MTDLVPCPLCGGSEGYTINEVAFGYALDCSKCQRHIVAIGIHLNRADAAWNAAGAYADGLRREVKRLCELCTSVHDRLLRGDSDSELLAMLEEAWKGGSDGR